MKKEEYIRKYGKEAYAKKNEQSRLWQKRHHAMCNTDPVYKKYKLNIAKKNRLKFKTEMGDAGPFVIVQISIASREHIEDLDKYILENLTREAVQIDGDPRLVNEDFLYECFIENCKYGLFYGNLQIIKYFVPLMCIKVHKGIEFTDKNIEMIKVFDEYRNTLNKKPIEYSFKMCYIRPDQRDDVDMNMKCMLLYNLSADFMHSRNRYQTNKKLY